MEIAFGLLVTVATVLLVRRRFDPFATGLGALVWRVIATVAILWGHLVMFHWSVRVAAAYVAICVVAAVDPVHAWRTMQSLRSQRNDPVLYTAEPFPSLR